MENTALALAARAIPYIKELRMLTGKVTAAILMQQLEYYFMNYPDGFYKFLSPCEHDRYVKGDSWSEELGYSLDEFRGAFARIGVQFKSKTLFDAAKSCDAQFRSGGMPSGSLFYYASFQDKIAGLTWYFRNHAYTDQAIRELFTHDRVKAKKKAGHLISVDRESQSTEIGKANLRRTEKLISVDGLFQGTKIGISHLDIKEAKITSQNNAEKTTESASDVFERVFERKLSNFQADVFNQQILNLACWEQSCKDWLLCGYSTRSLDKLLKKYQGDAKQFAASFVGASVVPSSEWSSIAERVIEPPPPASAWGSIYSILERSIEPTAFRTWFCPLTEVAVGNDELYLQAPDDVFIDYIKNNYACAVQDALIEATLRGLYINEERII